MKRQTIGTVAKAAGVNVETIRFYERKGLVQKPVPVSTTFREYPPGTAARIRFIKRAQNLGFTLAEITDLLKLSDGDTGSRADVKRLAELKLVSIRQRIIDLQQMETTLQELVCQCSGRGDVRGCPIIQSLVNDHSEETEEE
ncbi:MerR family DNA-binding protein [Stieleria sp. JC731]|uniref:MerR family transcriptional regulator n=1 Tax=Pirellulaceae TaxID=2691357 RepID=UPI001E3A86A7|nr:MerR family DNA-binding protein [Stieleria sp. JC731]MCC9601362.1 MerR family DNA-binding protein [Stieleria sp. JC731]